MGRVGVVYDDPVLPYLYGPVENNLTDEVTNNKAEVEAAILGLEEAKTKGSKTVILHTDYKLVEDIMTTLLDKWKGNNWKKTNGKEPKFPIDWLKKLDMLRSNMKISCKWVPRNSSLEMEIAHALANLGCECVVNDMQGRELTVNQIFRRTAYDRKIMHPDDLPPTVIRCKEKVMIPPNQTINIPCTLDIPEELKNKLIKNKTSIMNMTSDQAYDFVTTMRTVHTLEENGRVFPKC